MAEREEEYRGCKLTYLLEEQVHKWVGKVEVRPVGDVKEKLLPFTRCDEVEREAGAINFMLALERDVKASVDRQLDAE